MWEKFMEDFLLWEAPHAGAEKDCKESSSPEEKEAAETEWWIDHRHHFQPHWSPGGEEGEKIGGKVEPRKRGWV